MLRAAPAAPSSEKTPPEGAPSRFYYYNETLFRIFNNFDGLVSDYKKELSSDTKLITVLKHFSTLQQELSWFSLILSLLMFPISFYRIFHTLFINDGSKLTRGIILGITASNIVLATLSLLISFSVISIAAPVLVIIGSVRGLFEKSWFLGEAIYRRYKAGQRVRNTRQKLKEELLKPNPDRNVVDALALELARAMRNRTKRNKKIFERIHSMVTNLLGTVGSIMLLTPAAPVGLIILATLSVYKILDTLQLNPLRHLASFINKLGRRNVDPIRKKSAGKPFINVSYRPKLSVEEHKEYKRRKLTYDPERVRKRFELHDKIEKLDADHLLEYYCNKLKVLKPVAVSKETSPLAPHRTERLVPITHSTPATPIGNSSPPKRSKIADNIVETVAPPSPRQTTVNLHKRLRERSISQNSGQPGQHLMKAPETNPFHPVPVVLPANAPIGAPTTIDVNYSCAFFSSQKELLAPSVSHLHTPLPIVVPAY